MRLPKGKGMFIWKLSDIESGNVKSVIEKASFNNLEHILVKFADGRDPKQHDAIKTLMPIAREKKIEVWGWPYIYGNDPVEEAKLEGEWAINLGFDGFVIDAEVEYKNNKNKAILYMNSLRKTIPNMSVGLSSYWWKTAHSSFPWDEFMAGCDFVMPQVYWSSSKRDPVETLNTTIQQFSIYNKPIIPTGGDFGVNFKIEELNAFMNRCIELKIKSFNFWHWGSANQKIWDAIKNFEIPLEIDESSSWAKEAWGWAFKNGLMDGKNPKDNLTREMLATILYRFKNLK